MPSFETSTYRRQFPMSPPEYNPAYAVNRGADIQLALQMPLAAHGHIHAPHEKDFRDFVDAHHAPPSFMGPAPLPYGHPPLMPPPPPPPPTYDGFRAPGTTHRHQMYGPATASMPAVLPPMHHHLNDRVPSEDVLPPRYPGPHESHRQADDPAKEEKAVGGVSAHLDYDMDQMSGFVSEMAQGMYDLYKSKICLADIDIIRSVQAGSPVSPAFRKFVSQMLSSTRLPTSTILLALYYLATRMTMLSSKGQHQTSNGQVYRMLTVALLLGSKFLDDNTFQNRSWSEVSGLPVTDLNTLETEWLIAVEWDLHVDPMKHQNMRTMLDHWTTWQNKAAARTAAAAALRLAPIDTTVLGHHTRRPEVSPTSRYPPMYPNPISSAVSVESSRPAQYQHPARPDKGIWGYPHPLPPPPRPRTMLEYSPPSAPETGPNTPDYRGYAGPWQINSQPPPYSLRHSIHLPSQPPSYHHTPYSQYFSSTIWGGHTAGCACPLCARSHDPYFMTPTYGPQPVVG